MKTIIKNKNTISKKDNLIILANKNTKLASYDLNSDEKNYIKSQQKNKQEIIVINQYSRKIIIVNPNENKEGNLFIENIRCLANKVFSELKEISGVSFKNFSFFSFAFMILKCIVR